jgi:hypothetical protein
VSEAWIERMEPLGDTVVVALSLADGAEAWAVVERDEAEWLDLRPGQIVTLQGRSAGEPGLAVVGQGVDFDRQPIAGDVREADRLEDVAHVCAQRDPDAL